MCVDFAVQMDQTTIQENNSEVLDTAVIVTGDSDYSNVEIGDLNEERSEMSNLSHSSSAETLLSIKSISPKRQPPSSGEGEPSSIQHDMNGNPEYNQPEPDDLDTSETQSSVAAAGSQSQKDPSEKVLDIGSLLDADELPLLFVLRVVCKTFLLKGEVGQLVHDRHVRVSLKSLALGCVASIFSLCPRLALGKLVPSDEAGERHHLIVVRCMKKGKFSRGLGGKQENILVNPFAFVFFGREREREYVYVGERERERVCLCVCERERDSLSLCMCVCERVSVCEGGGGGESVYLCVRESVCVCERECLFVYLRERESVYV